MIHYAMCGSPETEVFYISSTHYYHFNCHMGMQPWDIHNIATSKQRKP